MRVFALIIFGFAATVMAQNYDYLTKDDQKYYSNDAQNGLNNMQRIDSTVREINKLHGMVSQMKVEIAQLKADVEELKKKK